MTLHCGDSLAYLKTLPDNSVDAVVTDPPYFKVKGEAWDRQWATADGFFAWLDLYLCEFQRLLRPNGSLYLFASPQMAARVECKIAERFSVLNRITWAKHDGTDNKGGKWSSVKKEGLRRFFTQQEVILFAEHKNVIGNFIKKIRNDHDLSMNDIDFILGNTRNKNNKQGTGLCKRWEDGDCIPSISQFIKLMKIMSNNNNGNLEIEYEQMCRYFSVTKDVPYTDVWEFATVGYYEGKHPCEKPADLLQHIIRTSTRPGAVVLDPFMGSGSTGLAALALGRDFIGCELDDRYFRMASERLTHAAQCADTQVLATHHTPEPSPPKQHAQPLSLFA